MGAGAVKPVPKVSVEGCHAGGCEVGLALAQEAPDGQEGGARANEGEGTLCQSRHL